MNFFTEKINKKNNSHLFSTTNSSTAIRTCTPCCPFDAKNLPHPQFNYFPRNQSADKINKITSNSDACCLSKLQVDCRIQCKKKEKKHKKIKRYSSSSTKRSLSSSSSYPKRRKFASSSNTNSHYIHPYDFDTQISVSSTSDGSDITEQSLSSNESKRKSKHYNQSANTEKQHHHKSQSCLLINENIQSLKTSIDNLTQFFVHQQTPSLLSKHSLHIPSISLFDKLRRFFNLFQRSAQLPDGELVNEECCQILERHHLTKEKLLGIYQLFNRNETMFLNWLQTIMPNYFLPLLLNYVKHFDSISTDNI